MNKKTLQRLTDDATSFGRHYRIVVRDSTSKEVLMRLPIPLSILEASYLDTIGIEHVMEFAIVPDDAAREQMTGYEWDDRRLTWKKSEGGDDED